MINTQRLLILFYPLLITLICLRLTSYYLKNKYFKKCETIPQTIVLLAGGIKSPGKLSDASIERAERARDIILQNPQSRLVITGGKPSKTKNSESFLMKEYLKDTLQEKLIRIEEKSRSTFENAMYVRELRGQNIALITSDIHMPRAQMIFDDLGFKTCAITSETKVNAFRKLYSSLKEPLKAWYYWAYYGPLKPLYEK